MHDCDCMGNAMVKSFGAVRDILGNGYLRNRAEAEQTMGMPIARERLWSAEDVWALPDEPGTRYETVDGVLLVSAAPRIAHQVFAYLLAAELSAYVREQGVGFVSGGPGDVLLDPMTVVQPDLFVLPIKAGIIPRVGTLRPTPTLVIEVLSPSTARQDKLIKRQRYQRADLECWLVDIDSRLVEKWMPDAERPEICVEHITWQPAGAATALRVKLVELFEHAFGED